jgi:transmembrane sensor
VDDELLMRVLTGSANDAERAAVEAWKTAAPENARHLHELEEMLGGISTWYRATPSTPPPAAETLIRRAGLRQARLGVSTTPARWRRAARWLAGVAAILLIGVGAVLLSIGRRRKPSAVPVLIAAAQFTSGDSVLPITLNDGTRIQLGPHSRLHVDTAREGRRVSLDGRADFVVAPDRRRPFVVRTSAGEVRDVDTHFVVRATPRQMHVAVFQGTVILAGEHADIALAAGELGGLSQGESPRVLDRAVPRSADEWLGAELVFDGETVAQVAQEVQARYHLAVRVTDSVVARRTVVAWFTREPATGAHDVLVAVCRAVGARCVITDSLATISSQPQ